MLSSTKRYLFIPAACVLFILASYQTAFAQPNVQGAGTLGVARIIEVQNKNVKDGSIISAANRGAKLSDTPYDPQVIGVVSQDAGILFASDNVENGVPVISTGKLYVIVSAQEGEIKRGDLITTSTIPGVAVKAVKDGYVLGMALEDYNNPNPKQTELIAVELNLHYFNAKPTLLGSLTDILKFALLPTKDSPTPIFKYIVSAQEGEIKRGDLITTSTIPGIGFKDEGSKTLLLSPRV